MSIGPMTASAQEIEAERTKSNDGSGTDDSATDSQGSDDSDAYDSATDSDDSTSDSQDTDGSNADDSATDMQVRDYSLGPALLGLTEIASTTLGLPMEVCSMVARVADKSVIRKKPMSIGPMIASVFPISFAILRDWKWSDKLRNWKDEDDDDTIDDNDASLLATLIFYDAATQEVGNLPGGRPTAILPMLAALLAARIGSECPIFEVDVAELDPSADEEWEPPCSEDTPYGIRFTNPSQIMELPNWFADNTTSSRLKNLKLVDLSGTNITATDENAFCGCEQIEAVFLPASLREIHCFCAGAQKLKSLDLSALHELRVIGDSFLAGCKNTTQLKFSPVAKLEEIPGGDSLQSLAP